MLANQLTLAESFAWIGMSFLVVWVFGWRLWKNRYSDNRSFRFVLCGVIWVAIGSGLYRAYWSVWRIYRILGDYETAVYLTEINIYFTSPLVVWDMLFMSMLGHPNREFWDVSGG